MNKQLALELPGIGQINGYPYLKPELSGGSIGEIITQFASIALFVAGFLMFIYFLWGVFEYIFAGGNKETIGKARKRMTWAIVGFVLFTISFAVSQYASTLLKPNTNLGLPETIERNSRPVQPGTPATQNAI